MFKIVRKYINRLRNRRLYVTVDPADSSITFSPTLYSRILRHAVSSDSARVIIFRLSNANQYAFMVNPDVNPAETILADIQYNPKYDCVGFEALCPTVSRILFDYSMPYQQKCRISVSPEKTADGKRYYILNKPAH